jgi:hypothetical protein
MTRPGHDEERSVLEGLLDRIACGSIEDVDELQPQDVELLRKHFGDQLEDLFDRLREGGDDRK